MSSTILDMGKIKKRSVRESIISILAREYPLNIKKIYNRVKKEYRLSVTYQAVFKTIKEMVQDTILKEADKEYSINIPWIIQLENEISIIKTSYGIAENENERALLNRVNMFTKTIGPEIKKYVQNDEVCVIGICSGSGRIFGSALTRYLLREGIKTDYTEFDKIKQAKQEQFIIPKEKLENKKIIVADSAIYSGMSYNFIMEKLNKNKNKLKIKDIKYAVEKDSLGLADFSVSSGAHKEGL